MGEVPFYYNPHPNENPEKKAKDQNDELAEMTRRVVRYVIMLSIGLVICTLISILIS